MSYTVGRHIGITKGFTTAPAYAKSIGCSIFQIFLGAPQRILSKPRIKSELVELGESLVKLNISMVVHGSYTINLCHNPGSPKFEASVKSLVQDLDATKIIGENCLGVIIHMGKNIAENQLDDKEAFDNYVIGLKKALSLTTDSNIILETGASQGTEIGSKLEGLSYIYWRLKKSERARVRFCIDTCHIWATGYDISNRAGVKKFFAQFDDLIGIDKIACIHFNDSKTGLHSCVDRHDDIGYGQIGEDGLRNFALVAKKHNIPIIMETPLSSLNKRTGTEVTFKDELKKIKSWLI